MGRGEFLKWSFRYLREKSLETVKGSFAALTHLPERTGEALGLWHKVIRVEQLTARPKLLFCLGRPYYLFVDAGELTAYKAACPKDEKMLQWQEHRQEFCCFYCQTSYDKKGVEVPAGVKASQLAVVQAKLEGGYVYIRLP